MKHLLTVLLALALAIPAVAQQKKAADQTSITGEIIDVKCYLTGMMGGRGPEHEDCAIACNKGGLPVGIVEDKTDKVYTVIPEKGTKGANETLLPYTAKRVTLKGKIVEKGGTKYFAFSSVEAAK